MASIDFLNAIRKSELENVKSMLPASGRLLEIGAGTGVQAQLLTQLGYEVAAIEVEESNYQRDLIWPVTVYDGHAIPFEDESFDIVFSSNVLEHIPRCY